MNDVLKAQWERFISGYWTKETPNKPGRYKVAARDGSLEAVERLVYLDPDTGSLRVNDHGWPWEGWWWSEPTPDMPKPPKW